MNLHVNLMGKGGSSCRWSLIYSRESQGFCNPIKQEWRQHWTSHNCSCSLVLKYTFIIFKNYDLDSLQPCVQRAQPVWGWITPALPSVVMAPWSAQQQRVRAVCDVEAALGVSSLQPLEQIYKLWNVFLLWRLSPFSQLYHRHKLCVT